jgi:hypothetical protein
LYFSIVVCFVSFQYLIAIAVLVVAQLVCASALIIGTHKKSGEVNDERMEYGKLSDEEYSMEEELETQARSTPPPEEAVTLYALSLLLIASAVIAWSVTYALRRRWIIESHQQLQAATKKWLDVEMSGNTEMTGEDFSSFFVHPLVSSLTPPRLPSRTCTDVNVVKTSPTVVTVVEVNDSTPAAADANLAEVTVDV